MAAALILTIGILLAAVILRPGDDLDALLRERLRGAVVATMKSGATFQGTLFAADERSFVLRNAKAFQPDDGIHIPVDGELVLSRADVEYLQRP